MDGNSNIETSSNKVTGSKNSQSEGFKNEDFIEEVHGVENKSFYEAFFDQIHYNQDKIGEMFLQQDSTNSSDVEARFNSIDEPDELLIRSKGKTESFQQGYGITITESPCYMMKNWKISQLDGFDDEDIEDEEIGNEAVEDKSVFALNCESEELIQMINFLRSLTTFWETDDSHKLCIFKKCCFFCYMRSSSLRLNEERRKGPKGLKISELVSQLGQYQEKLFINWRNLLLDGPTFIENTLKLITNDAVEIQPCFGLPKAQCQICKFTFGNNNKLFFDVSGVEVLKLEKASVKFLMDLLITKLSKTWLYFNCIICNQL